jgi:molybdenum-dependent DNA-binding transcriptional regulator ModE
VARRVPRWVGPFLRALERTGEVRTAAENAGIDHTTAYARRRTHAEFAAQWAAALAAHAGRKGEEERAKDAEAFTAGFTAPSSSQATGLGPSLSLKGRGADGGEDFVVSGNQVRRANGERWGRRKAEAFLAELAACGNFRLASKAVGLSYEAVRKRRRNDPDLEAACQAAIAACQARAPEFLASAMVATFDPDELPDSEASPLPRVTVAEAIRIAQMKGPAGAASASPLASDEEMVEALTRSLAAFGVRVAKAEDAWEALKVSGVDPDRLGQLGEVVISAKWTNGDSRTDACPHCGRTFQLSFERAGRGGEGGG